MTDKFNSILIDGETEQKIKNNAPDKMPLNPTAQGWSGQMIRSFLAKSIVGNDGSILSVLKEKLLAIKNLFEETTAEFREFQEKVVSIGELSDIIDEIVDLKNEVSIKTSITVGDEEPDTNKYDTWLKPIVEPTMIKSMSLLQKDPPEIAREEVDLNLQELEKIENQARAKMAKISEIEKVNNVEIPEVGITQIDIYAKKEPKIVDVTELSKDNEPLDISEIGNATETIDIDLPEIERDTSINVSELDKEESQINILEIRKDDDDENSF